MPSPTPDLLGKRQFKSNPTVISCTSGTSNLSATLTVGVIYSMAVTQDAYFLQGTASASATISSNYLKSGERVEFYSTSDCEHVAVFVSTTGTAYLSKYE